MTGPGAHPLELMDVGVTTMRHDEDGPVVAYFVVLRLRHAELEVEFDIMLRIDVAVFADMARRMQEYLLPPE